MQEKITYQEAWRRILGAVCPVETETAALEICPGRVLGEDLIASADVPAFDRSPYDGYAFRAADIAGASQEHPVCLQIVEEIAAGGISHVPVTAGTAVRLMTGAPLPPGADTIEKFEKTTFTDTEVRFFAPVPKGSNVIRTGEDVRAGVLLAQKGTRIDTGLLGVLAAQNQAKPRVYRVPQVCLVSTGSELTEPGSSPGPGQILNTNRYTIGAAIAGCGCRQIYAGIVRDESQQLAETIRRALAGADAVILTGGVSAGKYDYTQQAMELAGVQILCSGVRIKPGMACVYGVAKGKPVMGLSGNPASSLTNFYVLAAPALRKLSGVTACLPAWVPLQLRSRFPKKSPQTRFLRGTLDLSDGTAGIRLSEDQGNVILRSAIGADAMAVVPAGSGPLEAGTVLQGFLL